MKTTKIIWNGKRLKDIYVGASKWQVFKYKVRKFFYNLIWWSMILGIVAVVFWLGSILNPSVIYTKAEVIKEVPVKAPVLDRIAKCESGNSHYDKNGQVVLNGNKNGSSDIGKFMINNRIWGKKATELGYNLMLEKDNEAFAHYLYEQYGSEPWIWTKPCWNR